MQKVSKHSNERYCRRLSSSKFMTHCDGKRQVLNKSQAESLCCDHL